MASGSHENMAVQDWMYVVHKEVSSGKADLPHQKVCVQAIHHEIHLFLCQSKSPLIKHLTIIEWS